MRINIKTKGGLGKFDLDRAIQIGLHNTSQTLVQIAQANAPYDTGKLKQSIAVEPAIIRKGVKKVYVGPRGKPQVYAKRREFENKKNPHKKFYMKRTYDTAPQVIEREFKKALEIIFKK